MRRIRKLYARLKAEHKKCAKICAALRNERARLNKAVAAVGVI